MGLVRGHVLQGGWHKVDHVNAGEREIVYGKDLIMRFIGRDVGLEGNIRFWI